MQVNLKKIATFRLFWGFKKGARVVRKKVSHVLKKLYFFQNLLIFFQKGSIVGTKKVKKIENFVFFCFYFIIKLELCSRREWKVFFHKTLVSIVGIIRENIFSKFDQKLKFFEAIEKKAARVGTKNCSIHSTFSCFFNDFDIL